MQRRGHAYPELKAKRAGDFVLKETTETLAASAMYQFTDRPGHGDGMVTKA